MDDNLSEVNRRRLLGILAGASSAGFAGCGELLGQQDDNTADTSGRLPGNAKPGDQTVLETTATEQYRDIRNRPGRIKPSRPRDHSYDYQPVRVDPTAGHDTGASILVGGQATPATGDLTGDRLQIVPGQVDIKTATEAVRTLLGVDKSRKISVMLGGQEIEFTGGKMPGGDFAVVASQPPSERILVARTPSADTLRSVCQQFS